MGNSWKDSFWVFPPQQSRASYLPWARHGVGRTEWAIPNLTAAVSPYFFIHESWFRVSDLAMVTWSEVWWEFYIKLPAPPHKLLSLWTKIKFAEISTKMCAAQWAMWWGKGNPCYLLEQWIPEYQAGRELEYQGLQLGVWPSRWAAAWGRLKNNWDAFLYFNKEQSTVSHL